MQETQVAAGCCGGNKCANSLIREMQISKTYFVISCSQVEAIDIGRILRVPTFGGSWSQDVVGLHLLVHTEAAVTALDAEAEYGETFSCEGEERNLMDL